MTENKEIPTPSAAGDAVDRYDIAQGFGGGRMEKIYGGNWVDYDDHERVVTDLRRNLDDALRTVSDLSATNAELRRDVRGYKNAHAVLTAMAQQRWQAIEGELKGDAGLEMLVISVTGRRDVQQVASVNSLFREAKRYGERCHYTHFQPLPPPPEEVTK